MISKEGVIKTLSKSSKFDELLHRYDTFLSIGESSTEILEHFGKEFQSKKYFSIGSNCVNANTLSLSCSFEETTLVDKQVDVIFCNPPLKEYEAYCKRIFEECLAK